MLHLSNPLIPANAGTQILQRYAFSHVIWAPAFAGVSEVGRG